MVQNTRDMLMQKNTLGKKNLGQDLSQNSFVYSEVSRLCGTVGKVLTTMKNSSNYLHRKLHATR